MVRPVVNTSSGAAVPLEAGFTQVAISDKAKAPYTSSVSCNLAGAKTRAVIYARSGTYQLSLWVEDRQLFKNELFNGRMGFEPTLYQVELASRGVSTSPQLKACRGTWSWGQDFSDGQCHEEQL